MGATSAVRARRALVEACLRLGVSVARMALTQPSGGTRQAVLTGCHLIIK